MQEAGHPERAGEALKHPPPADTQGQRAEAAFVPEDPTARKAERPYRYLAIQVPPKLRQKELFEPAPQRDYVAVVTNRAGRVIRHARRYVVVLSHLAAGLLAVCLAARVALARLAPG